jgi:hypothetical protein
MAPPSRRVRDAARTHGSTSLAVLITGNGRAHLARTACSLPGGGCFECLRVPRQAFPAVADAAHFTRMETTGTGAARNIRIDQPPMIDRRVLTQVHKGNKLDFLCVVFESRGHSGALGQGR